MDNKRRKISITKNSPLVIANDIKILKLDKPLNSNNSSGHCTQLQSSSNLSNKTSYRIVPFSSSPNTTNNLTQTGNNSGQVLVMMPNNREVLNHQNVFIKRTEDTFSKTVIDQKRRLMHKEIERRRRDKINDWIFVLSKQVPDCASDRTKQGQSKGGILAKTSKYIEELRSDAQKFDDVIKGKEELSKELERLRLHCINLEAENKRLISLLQEHNIPLIGN